MNLAHISKSKFAELYHHFKIGLLDEGEIKLAISKNYKAVAWIYFVDLPEICLKSIF